MVLSATRNIFNGAQNLSSRYQRLGVQDLSMLQAGQPSVTSAWAGHGPRTLTAGKGNKEHSLCKGVAALNEIVGRYLTFGIENESGNGREMSLLQFLKDNFRHLPQFPDFFVTFRILSTLRENPGMA